MSNFDIESMRERLETAIRDKRRNLSEVSLEAGLSKTYLHNVLRRGQTPSVDKLERVCSVLNISMLWVMYGLEVPDGAEEVFEVMRRDPDRFWAMMKLV